MPWSKKGSITVFLALVIPVLLLACLLLTDVHMARNGKRMAQRSVETCAWKILSGYSSWLKDNYHIYAYDNEPARLEAAGMGILKENLKNAGIYGFRVEELEILPTNPLVQTENLKKQIITVMEDLAYGMVLDEIRERMGTLDFLQQTSGILKMKMQIDGYVEKISDLSRKIGEIIAGGSGDRGTGIYVNMLNEDSGLMDSLLEISGIASEMQDIRELMQRLEEDSPGALLEEEIARLREKAFDLLDREVKSLVDALKEANRKAVEYIREILESGMNIHIISEEIRYQISRMESIPHYLSEILEVCADVAMEAERIIVQKAFDEILGKLNRNVDVLENLLCDLVHSLEEEGGFDMMERAGMYLEEYTGNLVFEEEAIAIGEKLLEDSRDILQDAAKKVLEKKVGREITIPEDTVILPSKNKEANASREFDVDVTGEDTVSVEKNLEGFGSFLGDAISASLENLLVNEYLLMHFSYQTAEKGASFFDNEVEYILWGNGSQQANILLTKSSLLLFRFIANTLHVYADGNKKVMANALAAGIAGWWTMGAGVPVLSNLICCAWALAEGGVDTEMIFGGGRIPLFKMQGDWITDLGLVQAGIRTPDPMALDYRDHLRIFLLTIQEETRLLRAMDLIQMNSLPGFDIHRMHTGVLVKARISWKGVTGRRYETTLSYRGEY
ncbi:MAG: DUF5702 domain-containing protein [Clostridia bacterium]